jgi:hypothetical protein
MNMDELWPHRVLATGPASARKRISEGCCPPPGRLSLQGIFLWGPVPGDGFAQLTYRESLRDIESCLRALQSKLDPLGFRGKGSRSTLADANESHDGRIFADFAQALIATARRLHACDLRGVDLDQSG